VGSDEFAGLVGGAGGAIGSGVEGISVPGVGITGSVGTGGGVFSPGIEGADGSGIVGAGVEGFEPPKGFVGSGVDAGISVPGVGTT